MKRNFMWLASLVAIALIGFTACDNEKNGGKTPEADGYGYASFTIALPNASLKAGVGDVSEGNTYNGTADESKVSSVLIGIYYEGECIDRIELDAKTGSGGTISGTDVADGATGSKFTTKAKKIAKVEDLQGKKYNMVVFLNPTAAVNGIIAKGRMLTDLQRAAQYTESEVVSVAKGIMMSNAKGLVEFDNDKLHDTAAAAEAEPSKLNVQVDRAVAKVFVNAEVPVPSGPLSGTGASAEMKGWRLDVTNKKMFYLRQMDKDNTEAAETATTPHFNSYAKDPNMSWATGTTPYPTDEFEYLDKNVTIDILWPAGYVDAQGHYVSENTMNKDSQYRPVSTHVVFAIKVVPDGFAAEQDYVVYNGVVYKVADFLQILQKIKDPTTVITLEVPVGLEDEVRGKIDDLIAKLSYGDALPQSFTMGNIHFYAGMLNYYSMPIRHFNDTQAPGHMAYGRYGVVRNNIYKLSVSKIESFGDPVLPEIPDEPDDKTVGYIAMSVEILPWMVRESGYEL